MLSLCLSHGGGHRRRAQTAIALQLFPFASWLQSYPVILQILLSPWIVALNRIFGSPRRVLVADAKAGRSLKAAEALRKMSVLGRKIPLKHWNFALDSLFLISPLRLDGGPFWVFLSQPPVEERMNALMADRQY